MLFLVDSGAGSCDAASGTLLTFCCVFAAVGESLGVLSERSDLLFAATTGVLGGFDELKKRPPPKDEYSRCDAGRRLRMRPSTDMISTINRTIYHIHPIPSREGYVTVTISPRPSFSITSSHSIFSPVSRHTTSVGSIELVLICRFSKNDRPSTTSKCTSSAR